MNCFLCGAFRHTPEQLGEHLIFWHGAPKEEAREAAKRISQGKEVSARVITSTEPLVWEQLVLPLEGPDIRTYRP